MSKRKASTSSYGSAKSSKVESLNLSEIDLLETTCQKWLMKSEAEGPSSYNINKLVAEENQTTAWEGVRNYLARNHMRTMKRGDLAFFYHSNAKNETGIVGIVVITKEFYNDVSYITPGSPYFDADFKDPSKWSVVDVTLFEKLTNPILLSQLKADKNLEGMDLLKKGNRLSVQRVTDIHWGHIVKEYIMK